MVKSTSSFSTVIRSPEYEIEAHSGLKDGKLCLKGLNGKITFLSFEPEELSVRQRTLHGGDWVLVGALMEWVGRGGSACK